MALTPLIQYMIDPDSRIEMTGIQLQICTQLVRQGIFLHEIS
jgi:hypothetical protein